MIKHGSKIQGHEVIFIGPGYTHNTLYYGCHGRDFVSSQQGLHITCTINSHLCAVRIPSKEGTMEAPPPTPEQPNSRGSTFSLQNKRSKDHTPRAPALSCNFLDLDGMGRCGFFLQATPDHDSSRNEALLIVGIIS